MVPTVFYKSVRKVIKALGAKDGQERLFSQGFDRSTHGETDKLFAHFSVSQQRERDPSLMNTHSYTP